MPTSKRYHFWLLLCLACWVASFACYRFQYTDQQPGGAVQRIEANLQRQQKDFELLLQNPSIRSEMSSGNISRQLASELISKDYYVYIRNRSQLLFWNNQHFADTSLFSITPDSPQLIRRLPFIGVAELIKPGGDSSVSVLACFPVARMYPFENDYLQSQFSVSNSIPSSSVIAAHPTAKGLPFRAANGSVLGYISIPPSSVVHIQPDLMVIVLLISGFLAILIWIHLAARSLTANKRYGAAFLFTLGAVVLLRLPAYLPGLPFHLRDSSLFSPELYGYNAFLPSLGDLLLNSLFLLWFFWFAVMRIPLSWVILRFKNKTGRVLVASVLILLLCFLTIASTEVLRSLVLDSGLSFDAEALHNARLLTTVGLFIAAVIVFSFALFLHFVMSVCDTLLKSRWWKYVLMAGCFYAAAFLFPLSVLPVPAHILLLWLLFSVLLWDSGKQLGKGPLELPLVMSAAFLCASLATLLFQFNERKNHIHEQRFAERAATETDERLEWYFPTLALRLQHDPAIANFLENPAKDARVILDRQINAYYLTNWLSNYNANLLLFDSCARPLYNADTFSFGTLSALADQAMPTADEDLFYRGGTGTDHTYLGRLPVIRDGHNLGFIFLDLSRKKATNETVFPELLLPTKLASQATPDYSYAVYSNNQIITQSNDYPFPYYLDPQTSDSASRIENGRSMSLLRFKADNGRVVLVLHPRSSIIDFLLLFSYLFGLLAVTVLLLLLYRSLLIILSGRDFNWHLSLRRRVQLAMLSLVFIAFALIGIATISLIRSRYQHAIMAQRLSIMELISNRMEQYLHESRKTDEVSLSDDPEFRLILARQAYNHNVDINLYDSTGLLLNTTREEIFNNGLLSNRIRPDIILQNWSPLHPYLIINESIGKLRFTTCYLPLKSSNGRVSYYLNMPFFSSARELNAQISYVVVALVNLYILALLLSGLLTVPLTNWLSGSLKKIIRHLERTDVTGNEPLHWPHDDEIGLLVSEYNKMVQKVEQSAALLARSERESAWREVARQVAHEIKNPLTPMRLNIQYLQKAIREGREDITSLTERLSHSLLAQIDHLSQVAGSFSSFASMPEPRPERIDLNEFVKRVVAMHQEQENVQVQLSVPEQNIVVFADRGQLLSILTNLIQNAVQSIPDQKADGWIRVSLKPDDEWVQIIVADNGIGIPPEIREKIFTPYFTTKSSGTGLGLAMTRRMVEGAGGNIRFETGENGTRFFVALPIVS